jgi:proteic killer suppression protein
MIRTFGNPITHKLHEGSVDKKLPTEIVQRARLKLAQLDAATTLDFMRFPPSNRLELLQGLPKNRYSVRINQQWRLCFVWQEGNAYEVAIEDYH